jgi:hypothetical protein
MFTWGQAFLMAFFIRLVIKDSASNKKSLTPFIKAKVEMFKKRLLSDSP